MGRPLSQTPEGVLSVAIIPISLSFIAVALRFYTRRFQQKVQYGLDDWLCIPALILTMGLSVIFIIGAENNALGYPTPTPPDVSDPLAYSSPAEVLNGKLQFAYMVIQPIQLWFVKTSVILFYRRIFCSHNKNTTFHTITKFTLVFVTLWAVTFFFGNIFQCGTRFSANWTSGDSYLQYCTAANNESLALAVTDFATDLWILCLPIPMVWRLQLTVLRKIAVTSIFLLGALAVAASLTRMVTNIQAVTQVAAGGDPDLIITGTMYWGLLESGTALLAACLPSLRFLFGKWSPDALMKSIRSILSLESLRSGSGSNRSGRSRRQPPDSEANSIMSHNAVPSKPETTWSRAGLNSSTHATRDLEMTKDLSMESGQIHVKQGFGTGED